MLKNLMLIGGVLATAGLSLATVARQKADAQTDCGKQCAARQGSAESDCSKACPVAACSKAKECATAECAKQCPAKACSKECTDECATRECVKEGAATPCTKTCAEGKECTKACSADSQCTKACAQGKACTKSCSADAKCSKVCAKDEQCTKVCSSGDKCSKACAEGKDCTKACSAKGEAECKAKCPVSGKDADTSVAVDYKGGKLYMCCPGCPGAFEKNTAKFAAKANHQLVLTGQAKQTGCPFSGGKCNPETTIAVGDVKVSFCCNGCKGKATKAEGDDQVALLFGDGAFKKGFQVEEKKDE